jgi:hypothetical protein
MKGAKRIELYLQKKKLNSYHKRQNKQSSKLQCGNVPNKQQ